MKKFELTIFNYGEKEVRTVQKDNETWFVLKDVCDILELSSPHKVAERLDDDEKGRSLIPTLGGEQDITVINESGLYNVILRSDKPEAKKFKRWVTHEVLPSIRKTGSYNQPMSMEDIIIYQMSETKRIKQTQIEQQHQLDTVDDDEKLNSTILSAGQNREMSFLTEDGDKTPFFR